VTVPTPERPLDAEALKRRLPVRIPVIGEAARSSLAVPFTPAERDAALAELERLRQRVAALEIALRDTDARMWEWSGETGHDEEPDGTWRPLSVREQRRVNALLLGPADGAAREAEEVR
jgi:hypothetical protein